MVRQRYDPTFLVLILIVYIFLVLLTLKSFKIIPDPPDVDIPSLLITGAISFAAGASIDLYRRLKGFKTKIDGFEEQIGGLRTEIRSLSDQIRTELKHLSDQLDVNSRVAKLEALVAKSTA